MHRVPLPLHSIRPPLASTGPLWVAEFVPLSWARCPSALVEQCCRVLTNRSSWNGRVSTQGAQGFGVTARWAVLQAATSLSSHSSALAIRHLLPACSTPPRADTPLMLRPQSSAPWASLCRQRTEETHFILIRPPPHTAGLPKSQQLLFLLSLRNCSLKLGLWHSDGTEVTCGDSEFLNRIFLKGADFRLSHDLVPLLLSWPGCLSVPLGFAKL